VIFFCFSNDNWVATSKLRMLSTSSQKTQFGMDYHSKRKYIDNTSTNRKFSGSVIKSTLLNSYSNKTSLIKSIDILSSTLLRCFFQISG
jgi:uncharacterized protein YfiM (DUF2279 family)